MIKDRSEPERQKIAEHILNWRGKGTYVRSVKGTFTKGRAARVLFGALLYFH
jgi:hypothetical protein